MAKINVTLINFHGPNSHLEILLEDKSTTPSTYYLMNRWAEEAQDAFQRKIDDITATFGFKMLSFDIEANPKEIVVAWKAYKQKTQPHANIFYNNCADAAQWFLKKYANIPNPKTFSAPYIAVNHLAFGICVPSFLPVGVTLPGRVMDNARFYINARKNPRHHEPERSSLSFKLLATGQAAKNPEMANDHFREHSESPSPQPI